MVLNQKNSMRGENRLYFFRIRTTVSPTIGTDRGPFQSRTKVPPGGRNFLPPEVKNPALSLRGFSAALRRYMIPDFWHLHANAISCTLTRDKHKIAPIYNFWNKNQVLWSETWNFFRLPIFWARMSISLQTSSMVTPHSFIITIMW